MRESKGGEVGKESKMVRERGRGGGSQKKKRKEIN